MRATREFIVFRSNMRIDRKKEIIVSTISWPCLFKIFQQKHHLAKTRLTRGIINNILMMAVLITNTGKFRNDSSLKRKQKQQHYDARFERAIREYFQFQFV